MTTDKWIADKWIAVSAVCTGLLALATFILAYLTYRLEGAWVGQSRVNVWIELKRQFDSKEMKQSRMHGEDRTLFEDFEYIAGAMRMPGEKIDHGEIELFLENEARLN